MSFPLLLGSQALQGPAGRTGSRTGENMKPFLTSSYCSPRAEIVGVGCRFTGSPRMSLQEEEPVCEPIGLFCSIQAGATRPQRQPQLLDCVLFRIPPFFCFWVTPDGAETLPPAQGLGETQEALGCPGSNSYMHGVCFSASPPALRNPCWRVLVLFGGYRNSAQGGSGGTQQGRGSHLMSYMLMAF